MILPFATTRFPDGAYYVCLVVDRDVAWYSAGIDLLAGPIANREDVPAALRRIRETHPWEVNLAAAAAMMPYDDTPIRIRVRRITPERVAAYNARHEGETGFRAVYWPPPLSRRACNADFMATYGRMEE